MKWIRKIWESIFERNIHTQEELDSMAYFLLDGTGYEDYLLEFEVNAIKREKTHKSCHLYSVKLNNCRCIASILMF